MATADHWPLLGLRARAPRVERRHPDDELAGELADLAVRGIHEPGFLPFLVAWDDVPSPHQQRNTLQPALARPQRFGL